MFSYQDQFSTATRNNVRSQLAMMTSLTDKSFESIERLFTLNFAAARASMEESSAAVRQLLSAKDLREVIAFSAAQARPGMDKAMAYSRHVANIASSAQTEFINAAETQFNDVTRNVTTLIDDLSKHAPAGSEPAVSLVRSTIEAASAGYEQVTRSARQAASMIGGTMEGSAGQSMPVSETVVVVAA